MHKGLSHLRDDQVNELMERYYNNEKIEDLLNEFKLDIHSSRLVKLFPPIICSELFCTYCPNTNLITERKSRSDNWSKSIPSCPLCKHQKREECCCDNCQAIRRSILKSEENYKRGIIEEFCNKRIKPPVTEELTIKDLVYLYSIISHSASEDLKFVRPFERKPALPPLAPRNELISDIIRHLQCKSLITVSPLSKTSAFIIEKEQVEDYHLNGVVWELIPNTEFKEKLLYIELVRKIIEDDESIFKGRKDDIVYLWQQITKYECIQYLCHLFWERRFTIEPIGSKTHLIFENLLEYFSVGQIFNLSWQAVRDTTDYIAKNGIRHLQSENIFISAIQRKADKARAEGWEIKNSRRDFNCPQTILSSVFFNTFLKKGEKYLEISGLSDHLEAFHYDATISS